MWTTGFTVSESAERVVRAKPPADHKAFPPKRRHLAGRRPGQVQQTGAPSHLPARTTTILSVFFLAFSFCVIYVPFLRGKERY